MGTGEQTITRNNRKRDAFNNREGKNLKMDLYLWQIKFGECLVMRTIPERDAAEAGGVPASWAAAATCRAGPRAGEGPPAGWPGGPGQPGR